MTEPHHRLPDGPDGHPQPARDAAGAPEGVPATTTPEARRRLARRLGLTSEPVALRWLFGLAVPAMLVAVLVSLLVAGMHGLPPEPQWLAIGAGCMALSQLARLPVRTQGGPLVVGWGEAALIVCLYGVPPAWIPVVIGAGALTAHLILLGFGRWISLAAAMRNAAGTTLGGTAGTLAALAITDTYHQTITPVVALAMCAAAASYFLVTAAFVAAIISARGRGRFLAGLGQALRNKLLMVIGNVAVGLGIVAMLGADWRWVVLLPPVLWLLQQTYSHRLRADEERRTWAAFAGATKALNQLREPEVAAAGVHGAITLFAPKRAQVTVIRPDGQRWHYHAERGEDVVESQEGVACTGEEHPTAARHLLIGGVTVGELRLWFDMAAKLTPRQQMAFSAYADALAAALHDAATHRELQVITARSSYDAAHDPLTGLANRATMLAAGDTLLRQLGRDTPVALLLLDVDHFKDVNDTLGHGAGDDLLRVAGTRIGELIRPGELLARLGGDEFALLFAVVGDGAGPVGAVGSVRLHAAGPDQVAGPVADPCPLASVAGPVPVPEVGGANGTGPVAGADQALVPLRVALRRARQIAEHLATPTEVAGVQLSVEASVGVVVAPAGSADMSELLRRADIAMYQAKRGGASVAWYDSAKDAASTDQLALLAELREALATSDQLVLALQPAVHLATGAPTGVEALIRWRHPRRGLLGPGEFVRAVENSELLGPFTRHVIDLALGVAANWPGRGQEVPIAVNMSPRSLLDARLPADVAELLRRHHVPAHRLVLEITETVVMSELEIIDEVLAGLRALGVQLAVDDFGTGYSSLTFLTRITVDEVKVDRAFVAKMVDSPEAAAIVRTTVDLGRELGLRVVAEGVETAEQRAALAALGCTAAQGYHFFPPMPAEKIGLVLSTLFSTAQARVIPLRADGVS